MPVCGGKNLLHVLWALSTGLIPTELQSVG